MNKGWMAGVAVVMIAAGTMLMPKPAEAYWVRGGYGWGWRAPVIVAPGPVVVGAPYGYPAHPYRWVPAHYNRFGYLVPAHRVW